MATPFPDIKPFPTTPPPAPAAMGHNRPPLDEMVVAEFMEDLACEAGLFARIEELTAKGKAATVCDSEERAGRMGDFVKAARVCSQAVESIRERHNRPILTAQRALKAKADGLVAPLTEAVQNVSTLLNGFIAEQRRIAAEKARKEEEQRQAAARAAAEEARRQAEEAGDDPEFAEPAPVVEARPVEPEKPVVRGDYGARVGTTTVWKHEIESVRKLPDAILKHPAVIEALDKVIRQRIRGGEREIKGTRIWSEQVASVR